MTTREVVARYTPARDLCLKTPPNWTAVVFFAVLSGLHFSIAVPAFDHGHWEGYLSLIFGLLFVLAAVCAYFSRYEMTILSAGHTIRLRSGLGMLRFQRFIPFSDVHAVRLTLAGDGRNARSTIHVLCDNEDIECPPTSIPRQQALFLAITMHVQLIKVMLDGSASRPAREL